MTQHSQLYRYARHSRGEGASTSQLVDAAVALLESYRRNDTSLDQSNSGSDSDSDSYDTALPYSDDGTLAYSDDDDGGDYEASVHEYIDSDDEGASAGEYDDDNASIMADLGAELEDLPGMGIGGRTDMLRALLTQRSGMTENDLLDDFGRPMDMGQLLRIAQVSPIWPLLGETQKRLFIEESGTLASGKKYTSRRMQTYTPIVPKRMMQLSTGKRVAI